MRRWELDSPVCGNSQRPGGTSGWLPRKWRSMALVSHIPPVKQTLLQALGQGECGACPARARIDQDCIELHDTGY